MRLHIVTVSTMAFLSAFCLLMAGKAVGTALTRPELSFLLFGFAVFFAFMAYGHAKAAPDDFPPLMKQWAVASGTFLYTAGITVVTLTKELPFDFISWIVAYGAISSLFWSAKVARNMHQLYHQSPQAN